jgi:replicative DNA helicase
MNEPLKTPQNTDIERLVLSMMLHSDEARLIIMDSLEGDDFYRGDNQILFTAIKELAVNGDDVNFITLKELIEKQNNLDTIAGIGGILAIQEGYGGTAFLERYIKTLKDLSLKRAVIVNCQACINDCYDNKEDGSIIASHISTRLFELNVNKTISDLTLASDIVDNVLDEFTTQLYSGKKTKGLSTGFTRLDRYTGGLQNGNLIILGGKSGDGKTALAVNIAWHVSMNDPILYFILEMDSHKVVHRLLASVGSIDFDAIMQRGCKSDEETKAMDESVKKIKNSRFFIKYKGELRMEELVSTAMRAKREHGIGLIVVDYLQQITVKTKASTTREQEVASVSRSLKALAMNLNIPVIALTQLNDDGMVRESRAIKHDADIVLTIINRHTEEEMYLYNGVEGKDNLNIRELSIDKNRNGQADIHLCLQWTPTITRFDNSTVEYKPKPKVVVPKGKTK